MKSFLAFFTFAVLLTAVECTSIGVAKGQTARTAAEKTSEPRPEVVLCATLEGMNTTVFMVFDLSGSTVLGDKSTNVVTLDAPSVEFNPWTFFTHDGSFGVALEEQGDKVTEFTTYGGYRYEYLKFADSMMSSPVFARNGVGEKGFGTSPDGTLWRVDGDTKNQIGQVSYQSYVTPDGEKEQARMVRLQGDHQKWMVDLGGKIMQLEDNGTLTQVGWVSWRKVTTPEGKHLGILMAKSMDKNAKWAGRYDGKLYQEK